MDSSEARGPWQSHHPKEAIATPSLARLRPARNDSAYGSALAPNPLRDAMRDGRQGCVANFNRPGMQSAIALPIPDGIPGRALGMKQSSRKVIAQMPAARRMAQLAQGLGLDLTDPLARDVEVLADFFQRVVLAVAQAEAHLQHLTLALGQHR